MKRYIYTLFLLCGTPFFLFAQLPEQNCITAIPVCQNSYAFANAFSGVGSIANEINPALSCLPNGEQNDVWFRFTVETAGNLAFTILPNNPADNYNWALYNITGQPCSAIFNGGLETACNASASLSNTVGTNGHTGAVTGHPYYGFLDPTDAFEMDIPVTAGQSYALNVSNFSGSTAGFSIDFGYSTAVLFNAVTPAFLFIEPVICGANHLIVHFNKPVLCSSVQPTDFVLGGYTVTNVSSLACNNQNESAIFRLDLSAPIINSSNFTLNLVSAISDFCGNTNASHSIGFNVAPVVANAGNDFIFCKGDNINIQLGDTSLAYTNTNITWTASSALVQNALSSLNSPTPTLTLFDIPSDTVQLILTVSTGNCIDQDTMYLYFRDCCKNYSAQIANFQNVACFNTSTGSAQATATGSISGVSPTGFSYLWSNNYNAFLATGLNAGTLYTVTVTDPLGCSDTASILLTQPAAPLFATATGSILKCFGANTGDIQLTVSGATPPYTFQWSNNATTEDLANLTAGTYTCTITDANNCTITKTATVTQPPSAVVVTGVGNTIACGATTGSVNISVSGGGSPYQYAWTNGATSQDISNLMPGTYTVTVTDIYGCEVPMDFTVNTLNNLTATATATDAACTVSPTGTATVSVSGGLPPYNYQWNYNGQNVTSITNLPAGLYVVTVTDATNCQVVAGANVGVAASMNVSANITPVSCHGGNNGAINLNVTSNNPNNTFTFQWSNNANAQNLANLSAGAYQATITDQNGCTISGNFTINQPPILSATTSATPISCAGGSNGTLTANPTGGTPPYAYQWSGGLNATATVFGVNAGTYTVTVTDAKNCTATASATVTMPTALSANLTPTVIACAGAATGTISTAVNGGTQPYAFNWSGGIGNIQNPSNLTAGTYQVTISDANGCSVFKNTTLNELPSMTINTPTVVSPTCNGGNNGGIILTINNGIPPLSFNWSGGIGNIQNPANLTAGTYSVTVTNGNGCSASTSTTLTQPLPLVISATGGSVTCSGSATANLSLSVNGGTAPYTFNWSNGIGTMQNPTNIGAGTYTVTVTDANGCTKTTSATISQPPSLTATLTHTNLNCFGNQNATITSSVSGGTPPYLYAWQNASTGSANRINLGAGTYTVTVTDANNCSTTATTTVTQPAAIQMTLTPTPVTCFGGTNGSISTSISGGFPPYTFIWNNNAPAIQSPGGLSANPYTGVVIDAHGCNTTQSTIVTQPPALNLMTATVSPATCNDANGLIAVASGGGTPPYTYQWSSNTSVLGNANTAANLGSGTYYVSLTDSKGCLATLNPFVFPAHPSFQLSAAVLSPSCQLNNGSIQITGLGSYTYKWSSNVNNGIGTNMVNNLTAGNYAVTVSDGVCDTVLNFALSAPILLASSNAVTHSSCGQANGKIEINVNTGVPPYDFNWEVVPNPGNVNLIDSLLAGIYRVTITDSNGCEKTDAILVNGTMALDVTTSTLQPDCDQLGSITLTPLQGSPPFQYAWNPSAIGNIPNPTNLNDGAYSVTVTDAANCEAVFNFNLATSGAFSILLNDSGDNECPDEQSGFIDISTTSASNLLQYQWSNQAMTEDLEELDGGLYTVTVTDLGSGCEETATFEVYEPDTFSITIPENVTIVQGEDILLEAITDNPNVIYSWVSQGNFISSNSFINVSPTENSVYTLTANLPACPPEVYQIAVSVVEIGDVLIPEAFTPNDDGQNDSYFIYVRNGIKILEFSVFNRWGEKMYSDPNRGWDGTYRGSFMPNDAYVYLIKFMYENGEEEVKSGQFLLLR